MAEPSTISDREQHVLGLIEHVRSRPAKFRDSQITMAHGAGGKATQTLIEGLFVPALGGDELGRLADAAELTVDGGGLAVNGTVNDLAVSGARPLVLTLSLVLEEGLPADVLRAEVEAIARSAQEAGVQVVAGDTKVVERGHADGM